MKVRPLFQRDFREAYIKSLRVKKLPTGARGIDAQMSYLFDWLIKRNHIVPGKYKVVARCGVCLHHFDPKKWDGTIIKKTGEFVCPRCVKKPSPAPGSSLLKGRGARIAKRGC